MSNSSSNVTSPSTSSRPSTSSFGTSMVKSGSNRSIFRDNKLSRSRQNTVGLDFLMGEDLSSNRNIGSDYQEIQIRTLTKWVNAQLRQADDSISNIKTDLRDGKKLLKLLSVVASEPAPKPERMNMRIHQLSNVAQALSFLERQVGSDSMPDIGNEAIVNGDDKKTLALIFFIMLKYQIQLVLSEHGEDYLQSLSELSERENGHKSQSADYNLSSPNTPVPLAAARKTTSQNSISDKLQHTSTTADAKMALLYWVRIQLEDYISANIIPSIQDFSRSWRSGIAFCLLIHRHNPTYIPDLFSTHLTANLSERTTWYELLKLAFGLASQYMDIEAFLEPEDLVDVDYPHEPSVMMYVSEYYKVMSKHQREEPVKEKRARAAKRKAAIVMAVGGQEEDVSCDSPPPLMVMDDDKEDFSSPPPPPETPEPVPVPSTIKRRIIQQRQSTLGEDEKAKIKADLNSKLMMQLTGHLPRGVHPTLDELLTIHDTVLSYIKLNTKTIDGIPEEFVSSVSASEYIDALEIIEEQSENEAQHLETAKRARDVLTSPPETADDTIIRLTSLQRSQVIKLYDILEKEWHQFMELLKTTKEDLVSIERVLIDTEESAEEYQSRANLIENQLNDLVSKLTQLSPESHPIEGTESVAQSYQQRVDEYAVEFDAFEEAEWNKFIKDSRQLSRAVMQVVTATSNRIHSKHDSLVSDFEKERQACKNFGRSLQVVNTVHSIESELEQIQSMMDDNGKEKATTNQAIQILENKVANVRSILYTTQQEYSDLFTDDTRLQELFAAVQTRYETVNTWVDQVRVWFIEAERIRGWIEERIQIITERNESITIDPLLEDFDPHAWSSAITSKIYEEHEKLKLDIERFNQDDMKRLRSHVRELTGTTDHHLTPADASTIEITLSTLTILDRMINMLRKRSGLIDMLKMRIEWEVLIEKAMIWCDNKNTAILDFIHEKAHWSSEQDKNQIKQLTEEIIQTLVSLENSIAEFDKGEFSAVLDAYQDMESLDNELPRHLEQRQEVLELSFELVMKKCAFARKVVEQFLVVSDVTAQYKKLKAEGGKLKSSMIHDTTTESSFDERVQAFKESSMHWVTTLVKRVPYPEVPEEISELEENNVLANQTIQDWMNDYATVLAELTEDLEDLLHSHRQDLSLQQRASLVYDDVLRVTNWLDDRLRAVQKFDSSVVEDAEVITLEDAAFTRLEKEHDSIASKLAHLEEHDLIKVTESVQSIEIEMDETNSLSIDRSALVTGIEKLDQSLNELKAALVTRTKEIAVLQKRVVWETKWEEAHQKILDLAHQLWDFNARFAQYDVQDLKENQDSVEEEVRKEDLYDQLAVQVQDLKDSLSLISSNTLFDQLEEAYIDYYKSKSQEAVVVPEHIAEKHFEIKSELQDLQDLFSYVTNIMKQHDSIEEFLNDTVKIQNQVEIVHNLAHTLKREASTSSKTASSSTTTVTTESTIPEVVESQDHVIQQIHDVMSELDRVFKAGESIQSVPGSNWFEIVQPQTLIHANDYNTQIKDMISRNLETMAGLKGSLEAILGTYQQMDGIRSKLVECQAEAREVQTIVENLAQTIKKYHVDVTAISTSLKPESVTASRSEIDKLTLELEQLESGRISALQQELSQLVQDNTKDSTVVFEDIKEACTRLSENVTRSFMFIQQSLATEKLVLDVAEKRIKWESDMVDGQTQIDTINKQLQQYISKKNKCVAQPEALTRDQIDDLIKEHSDINSEYQKFKDVHLRSLLTDYEDIKNLFIKLPFTKSIPIHIEERMDDSKRSLKKLEEGLAWRLKELDYIQQRGDLESSIKEAVLDLESQRKEMSFFIESKGRWNDIKNELLYESESQLQDAKSRFQYYREHTLSNIKQTYSKLEEISRSLKPGFMSEIHAKKMDQLTQLESNVQADIHFAQDTIIQRKQVTDFVSKSNDLEKEAEAIRELFLSDPESECAAKLQEFCKKVKETELMSKQNILIPKRTNGDEIPMATKVKDKTLQSVVQDIIDTRVGRLNELAASLSTLLKSQQVFTRLQYMLKTFKQQIVVCESWISSRRDILEKNVHVLDDSSLSLDVELLRDAVSEADSIQTAMNAQDNNFTLLCKYRSRYIQIFDEQVLLSDAEKQEKMAEFDTVAEDFERVNQAWKDLLYETKEVSSALTSALLPAEINYRITHVLASFNDLLEDIRSVDEDDVTDNRLGEWQKKIDYLESKEYDRLHSEMSDYKHSIDADMIDSLMNKLDEAGEIVLLIRGILTSLYDTINANRLRKTHTENSELFYKSAETIVLLVEQIQLGKFSVITDKKTPDERNQCYKDLSLAHRQIKETFLECQGFYDDSCSYYTAMRVQGAMTVESQQVQEKVEETWELVSSKNTELSAFITRNSKWIDGCNELDVILASLEAIKVEVNKYISNTTKIQRYERQLLKVFLSLDELENTVKNSDDLSNDEKNKNAFLDRSQDIRQVGTSIQERLDKRKLDKERIALFDVYKNEINKVTKVCDDQISYIRQQSNTNPDLKKLETINSITNIYSAALLHVQDKYKESKNKYDGTILDQATKLVKTYHHPESEVNSCKSNVDKLFKELKSLLKIETDYITTLKQLSHLMKLEKDVSRLITDLKATVSRSSKYTTKVTRTRNIPELKEFMSRYESIDKSIQEFYQKCNDVKKNINKRINSSRMNAITKNIDKRQEDMVKRWSEIKSSADDTRERLDVLHKRQVVTSKLSESIKYADSLKERVEALQLSGKLEEQELNEIQEEIDVTLKKSTAEIDTLLKSLSSNTVLQSSASETTLKAQREKLSTAIEELRELVQHRIKQAHTQGSITEFLGIIDQLDSEILSLSHVVEETSTQNASLDGSKFNKSDLQSLLKTLIGSFKKSEATIEPLLEKAKSESQKQFLDDNEKVANRLKKTVKDWATTKHAVSSREKELQACIKELNHEFFTKLAMAKSTPRERRTRKTKPIIQTPPGSSNRPPINFRSSTLSTEMKMTANSSAKRSKSPSNTKYVADPKNELDVQLGMIVNDSPYKMKVKMVPGQVGKYWFGEEHPRLVYCRILPSKMVMVRVGGGWQELSKFMKDHGHSDGLATKSDSGETQYLTVNAFKDPVDQSPSFSVTTRSGSPMGPAIGTPIIRRGSGVSSSLTNRSSNSSSTGYLEGDRFIQTDEDGNQVSLKMVRADSSSKPSSFK